MCLHKNAGLTLKQRSAIKRIYETEKVSYAKLAERFQVSTPTIVKWVKRDSPEDKKSGPKNPKKVITPAYQSAIINYRKKYPMHGPIRIAFELKKTFPFANRGTVLLILQSAKMTRPKGEKKIT